jgi:hypothetical protein
MPLSIVTTGLDGNPPTTTKGVTSPVTVGGKFFPHAGSTPESAKSPAGASDKLVAFVAQQKITTGRSLRTSVPPNSAGATRATSAAGTLLSDMASEARTSSTTITQEPPSLSPSRTRTPYQPRYKGAEGYVSFPDFEKYPPSTTAGASSNQT